MQQEDLRFWLTWIMVGTAALGTAYYFWIEYTLNGSLEGVAWSIMAVVWFVVLRRLWHYYR